MSDQPTPETPLAGKHLVSTRPRNMNGDVDDTFEKTLASWGAAIYGVPLIEIHALPFELPGPPEYDWLFFTSKNGVRAFTDQLDSKAIWKARIASVGPATGKQLLKAGQEPSFIPPVYEAEAAAAAFINTYGDINGRLDGKRILWPCGNLAGQRLAEILREAGATVDALVVYETRLQTALKPEAEKVLRTGPDMVIFTSSSAVQAYQNLGLPTEGIKIAVLGPVTERAACDIFGKVSVKAPVHTLDALANAILDFYVSGQG